jgi:hypothetical protein
VITWTAEGAVERPVMVQIRVQRAYPGRIRAGAPVATRSMTQDEVLANLRFFTVDMAGPRSRPCTKLVLSGVGVGSRKETPVLLAQARIWGIKNVVLHVGTEDLEDFDPTRFEGLVEAVVVPVQPGPAGAALLSAGRVIRACRRSSIQVVANTVLSPLALHDLQTAASAIASSGASRASLSYPFPIPGNTSKDVAPIAATVEALQGAVSKLERAGLSISIKGLPGCYLGDLAKYIHRSANRWYVDADHQMDDAVLFFPRVVSFTKQESCRFCSLDASCDGFFATYLRRPGFPALEPIQE